MIVSHSTEFGAGIAVFGDDNDLSDLHQTVHQIVARCPVVEVHKEFMSEFALELRKAKEGRRETYNAGSRGDQPLVYSGFKMLWPKYLTQLALLRWCAGFSPTSRGMQANLYRLEAAAEESLFAADPIIGRLAMEWLENFDMFPVDFISPWVDEVSLRYATAANGRKSKFRRLPDYLDMIFFLSPEYLEYVEQLESSDGSFELGISKAFHGVEIEW